MTIQKEIERVKSIDASGLNESTIQAVIVEPILQALGWQTNNPNEIRKEYSVGAHMKGSADIALLDQGIPSILIETKAPRHSLDTSQYKSQLLEYCKITSVQIGVLTNGLDWRIYHRETGADRIFLAETIDLINEEIDNSAKMFTELLGKDEVLGGSASANAKESTRNSILADRWKDLLARGDQALASRLRKEVRENDQVNIPLAYVKEFLVARSRVSTPDAVDASQSQKETNSTPPTPRQPVQVKIFGDTCEFRSYREVMTNFVWRACHQNETELENLRLALQADEWSQVIMVHSSQRPLEFGTPKKIGETNYWLSVKFNKKEIKQKCDRIRLALSLPENALIWLD